MHTAPEYMGIHTHAHTLKWLGKYFYFLTYTNTVILAIMPRAIGVTTADS